MFSLIYARINSWVNSRGAGDLRRHRVHYDVIVMLNAQHYRMVGMQIVLFSFVFGNTTFLKGHSVEPYIELTRLDFKCHCNTSLATETNIETSTETFDFSFRPWEIYINRGFYSSYEYINKNTHKHTHTHWLDSYKLLKYMYLSHWGRDKMAAISPMPCYQRHCAISSQYTDSSVSSITDITLVLHYRHYRNNDKELESNLFVRISDWSK